MKSHIIEKPFQCAICSKFFKNKQCLKKHNIRKHSGIFMYKYINIKYCFQIINVYLASMLPNHLSKILY